MGQEAMTDNFAKPSYNGSRFENPKSFAGWTGLPGFRRILKWVFCERADGRLPSKRVLEETLPVIQPPSFDLSSSLSATWLGHATVFVRLDGVSFITDPVWSSRCSPLHRIGLGPRRYRPPPCPIDELPKLDFGVISHNHYDHLDAHAVRALSTRFPDMEWLVPKGLKEWMRRNTPGNIVHELSWGEHVTLPLEEGKFELWCLPAQHWSQRGICDRNKTLWSGWAILGSEHKFYYTGDTGFCESEFEKLGDRLGPFDLAVIPIGCYAPRDFMSPQHIDPDEAVQIHILSKAVNSLAVHWGTYLMGSHEHYLEPRSKLREALEKYGLHSSSFFTLDHGGTWSVERGKAHELPPSTAERLDDGGVAYGRRRSASAAEFPSQSSSDGAELKRIGETPPTTTTTATGKTATGKTIANVSKFTSSTQPGSG